MRGICFTGKGYVDGTLRTRSVWEEMAESMGMRADKKVGTLTHILVASETETRKAKDAAALGVDVISYPDFQRMYEDCVRGGATEAGWQPGEATPQEQDLKDLMSDLAAGDRELENEAIPGWGMF